MQRNGNFHPIYLIFKYFPEKSSCFEFVLTLSPQPVDEFQVSDNLWGSEDSLNNLLSFMKLDTFKISPNCYEIHMRLGHFFDTINNFGL